MTQVVWVIGGKNKSRDYHFQETASALINAGVIEGLAVTIDSVAIWKAFIEVTRTWGATFKVPFFSSEVEAITTGISQKIFIEINQVNIDDGDLENSVDGTGIGTIKVAASFPAGNYIPLAESNGAGAITDLRVNIEYKKALQNLDWIVWDINTTWDLHAAFLFGDGSNITGLQAEVASTSVNYMLWSSWDVAKWYSLWNYEQLEVWTSNDVWSTAQPEVAQSFYAQDVDITTLKLMIKKVSSPSDNVFVEIQTDNAGVPSGSVVTNWTSNNVNYTTLTTSFVETTFTFASVPTLTAETLYHIVVKRSGATDAVNYYAVESAWSNVQIGTASLNTGSWANTTDDLYFKLATGYKLAILWGLNFIWICQISGIPGQIRKFNKDYDNNQIGLIPWNFYRYNVATWVLEAWSDFKAISETEVVYEMSTFQKYDFYGDWSDWVLNVLSWTTSIAFWEYNYSEINISSGATLTTSDNNGTLILKCLWKLTLDWTIDVSGKWNNWTKSIFDWTVLTPWAAGTSWGSGWKGANWSNGSVWGNGAAQGSWYGWGAGGGASGSSSYNWGHGWTGWTPGWLWWEGAGWTGGNWDWGDAYSGNWEAGLWGSWSWSSWGASGGTSAGWGGAYSNGAGGWGGAGWTKWATGWNLIIQAYTVEWNGTAKANWSAGWTGWNWGSGNPAWWGGGWGGAGGGWGWLALIYNTDNSTVSITATLWSWWGGWSVGAWNSPVAWGTWNAWNTGTAVRRFRLI